MLVRGTWVTGAQSLAVPEAQIVHAKPSKLSMAVRLSKGALHGHRVSRCQ